MEVPEEPLEKRTPDSRSCLPKPYWKRGHFRWPWGESSDDRPETGSRGIDV